MSDSEKPQETEKPEGLKQKNFPVKTCANPACPDPLFKAHAHNQRYCSFACRLHGKQSGFQYVKLPLDDLEKSIESLLSHMATRHSRLTSDDMRKLKVISEGIKFLSLKAKKGDKGWGQGFGEEEEGDNPSEKTNGRSQT